MSARNLMLTIMCSATAMTIGIAAGVGRNGGEARGAWMTLKQKRKIVQKFRTGETVFSVAYALIVAPELIARRYQVVEDVLRDFMNGKFTLKVRPKE